MSKITIEGTPVVAFSGSGSSGSNSNPSPLSISGHLLLIFEDDSGNEFVVRGGPESGPPFFGKLVLERNQPIDSSLDSRIVEDNEGNTPLDDQGNPIRVTPESRGSREIPLGDRDPSDVWNIILQHAENINNQFFYNPFGENSNGTVGNLLHLVGIDVNNVLPNPDGFMAIQFLGKDLDFAFDYSIRGTDEDDIIRGRGGNQTFFGGAGDDSLSGGGGDDRLNEDEGNDIAIYQGNSDEYEIEFLPDESVRISDSVAGRDGSDILTGMEVASFSDRSIFLSPGQDIAFVIDTTESMLDDIDAVKARASDIINSIFDGEESFLNSRIAVVGYNDPGTNTFLSFTEEPKVDDRKTAALNAINSISVGGGDDFPEVVNAGILRALSGGSGEWREEAFARRIILFGDAPPKDTELRSQVLQLASNVDTSISSLSLSSLSIAGDIETTNIADNLAVTRFALQTDAPTTTPTDAPTTTPVEIFTILIGDDPETAADFQSLATATGGQSFNALDATEIVDVIISAIQASPDDNDIPFDGISITTPIPNNLGRPENTFSNGFYYLTEMDDTGIPSEFAETPILALAGNDNLTGTEGRNYISGDQGSDTLSGLGGNDSLFGGQASDLIDGGAGDDLIWGSSDNDRLNGGDGNDSMRGGRANDVLTGDLGNDTLWGDSGQDILIGGPGKDIFVIASDPNVTTPIQQADVITDFEVGVDIIGLANNLLLEQLTFEPVNLQLDAGLAIPSTAIRLDSDYLAIVQGVADANVFATNTNFATV
ncbi:MAG: VWA domain-containing protein [Cyanobacteria bacterium P01_H01_bin.35]